MTFNKENQQSEYVWFTAFFAPHSKPFVKKFEGVLIFRAPETNMETVREYVDLLLKTIT